MVDLWGERQLLIQSTTGKPSNARKSFTCTNLSYTCLSTTERLFTFRYLQEVDKVATTRDPVDALGGESRSEFVPSSACPRLNAKAVPQLRRIQQNFQSLSQFRLRRIGAQGFRNKNDNNENKTKDLN